jgi:hypothetical protein
MECALESASTDISDDVLSIACGIHVGRCGGDASVHTIHSLLVTALVGIISEVRCALGVCLEVLTDATLSMQLPNCDDDPPTDAGVVDYHPRPKFALDAVVSGLIGVSIPSSSPEAALLSRAEKSKFDELEEGAESSRHTLHSLYFRSRNGVFSVAPPSCFFTFG